MERGERWRSVYKHTAGAVLHGHFAPAFPFGSCSLMAHAAETRALPESPRVVAQLCGATFVLRIINHIAKTELDVLPLKGRALGFRKPGKDGDGVHTGPGRPWSPGLDMQGVERLAMMRALALLTITSMHADSQHYYHRHHDKHQHHHHHRRRPASFVVAAIIFITSDGYQCFHGHHWHESMTARVVIATTIFMVIS